MGALSPTHWLIIIGVVVLLFGAKKLPDAARSMGQSMRILKAETSELRHPDDPSGTAAAPATPTTGADTAAALDPTPPASLTPQAGPTPPTSPAPPVARPAVSEPTLPG